MDNNRFPYFGEPIEIKYITLLKLNNFPFHQYVTIEYKLDHSKVR